MDKVRFPYKQEEYNRQVTDLLKLYADGKVVLIPGDGLEECKWCVRQMLDIYRRDEGGSRAYSDTAVESAALLMVEDGRRRRKRECEELLASNGGQESSNG